jgi:ABC-type multidrug transport system permease subunit
VPAALTASALLGGVYYPTHVIPSWLEHLSTLVPLAPALRIVRRLLLQGAPVMDVRTDVALLAAQAAVLAAVGTLVLGTALRHARRAGTLGQY